MSYTRHQDEKSALKRGIKDEMMGPPTKRPTPAMTMKYGHGFGPAPMATAGSSRFGGYKIPRKATPAEQEFNKRTTWAMEDKIKKAMSTINKFKAHTLFLLEEPFNFLDEKLFRTSGTVVCKMDKDFRPHLLPKALKGIPKDLGKTIDHVVITLTHNALVQWAANVPKSSTTVNIEKKPILDVFNNLHEIVESLVEYCGVNQVIIVLPPTIKIPLVMQKVNEKFLEAFKNDKYLDEHTFFNDFYSFSPEHCIETTPDGLQRLLRDTMAIYIHEKKQNLI